jgi:Flp pilus assembly protein TadD
MRVARLVILISILPGVLPAQDTAQFASTGQRALGDNAYTTAVYFLKQVVTADPKHPSAWKDLCRAYLALDQVDLAIDACLKQIDVHPPRPRLLAKRQARRSDRCFPAATRSRSA